MIDLIKLFLLTLKDKFIDTIFTHIRHNSEPIHEKRLYSTPQEKTIQVVYQFNFE